MLQPDGRAQPIADTAHEQSSNRACVGVLVLIAGSGEGPPQLLGGALRHLRIRGANEVSLGRGQSRVLGDGLEFVHAAISVSLPSRTGTERRGQRMHLGATSRTHAKISFYEQKGRARWPELRSEAGEEVRTCGRGG
jgi:hypothetical protein